MLTALALTPSTSAARLTLNCCATETKTRRLLSGARRNAGAGFAVLRRGRRAIGGTGIARSMLRFGSRPQRPPAHKLMPRIVSLHVYPVKSCRGVDLDAASVTRTGVAHDREWMITSPAGRFLTQREEPRLALIVPRLASDAPTPTAPDLAPLSLPI